MPCPGGQSGPGSCTQRGCWPWPSPFPPPCEQWPAGSIECCNRAGVGNEGDVSARMQCENGGGTWRDTGQVECGGIATECVDPNTQDWCWGGTSWEDWVLIFPLANVQVQKPMDCYQLPCWKIKCKKFYCDPASTTSIGTSFLT